MQKEFLGISIKMWLIIFLSAIAAGGIGFFGWNYLSNRTPASPEAISVTSPTAEVTATPVPEKTDATTPATTETKPTPAPTTVPTITIAPTPVAIPKVENIYTQDSDANGKIDNIVISFDKNNSQTSDCGMNQTIVAVTGFSIDGYTIKSGSWLKPPMYTCPDSRASDPKFSIKIKEKADFDTDARPIVSYDASLGAIKSSSGGALTNFTTKAQDLANPVLVSALAVDANNQIGVQTNDKVVLTFSEPVRLASNFSSGLNSALTLADGQHSWYSENSHTPGSITFSADNKTLTVALDATSGVPTIAVGDLIEGSSSSMTDFSADSNTLVTIDGIKLTGSF